MIDYTIWKIKAIQAYVSDFGESNKVSIESTTESIRKKWLLVMWHGDLFFKPELKSN